MGPLVTGYRRLVLMMIFSLFLQAAASATTYYIDYAAGSDANNGTSKTTPWQHMPGMAGCTSKCASAVPKAGDSIILKGGVTWLNAAFPITWTWSGTSSAPIYIGVDQTWYTGSSWVRPTFNAGSVAISGSINGFLALNSLNYVTVDNIEMKGLYWSSSVSYGTLYYIRAAQSTYITLSNLYLHGWTHGGTSADDLDVILGDTNAEYCNTCALTNSIVQNSDGNKDSGAALYAWGGSVKNSVFHDLSNGILINGHGDISGNVVYNINASFSGVHPNAIENTSADGGIYYIHDNVIHDITYGVGVFIGGFGSTYYFWNNLLYSFTSPVSALDVEESSAQGSSGTSVYIWNNTIVPYAGAECAVPGHSGIIATLTIQNNHCISTASVAFDNGLTATTLTSNHNTLQTTTQAAAAGYSAAQGYAYSPSSSNCSGQPNCPVGAGTDAASVWPAGYSTNDTVYACTVDATNHVNCPARTPILRAATWDAGAYLYSSSGTAPAAPTNLSATVQ